MMASPLWKCSRLVVVVLLLVVLVAAAVSVDAVPVELAPESTTGNSDRRSSSSRSSDSNSDSDSSEVPATGSDGSADVTAGAAVAGAAAVVQEEEEGGVDFDAVASAAASADRTNVPSCHDHESCDDCNGAEAPEDGQTCLWKADGWSNEELNTDFKCEPSGWAAYKKETHLATKVCPKEDIDLGIEITDAPLNPFASTEAPEATTTPEWQKVHLPCVMGWAGCPWDGKADREKLHCLDSEVICNCDEGYKGKLCDQPLHPCIEKTCQNNGLFDLPSCSCICPENVAKGDLCEICIEQPCLPEMTFSKETCKCECPFDVCSRNPENLRAELTQYCCKLPTASS